MSGTLTLVIGTENGTKAFKWKEFKQFCEEAHGGVFKEPSPSEDSLTVDWLGTNVKEVLTKAEERTIDNWIKKRDGLRLLEIREGEECLYSYVPDVLLEEKKPKTLETAQLIRLASQVDILIVTATDIERKTVLAEMKPWPGEQDILQGAPSQTTYRFGRFGRYCTAHVECTMGSGGVQGATLTTQKAIQELKPKAVLILGIAFGIDRKKQYLGDVIVAESVSPYEVQRVETIRTIPRGTPISCGVTLSERFRNNSPSWQLECGRRSVKVHRGAILSGEKLVDNKEFRDQLVNNVCQTALGGEMEGVGAYAAARGGKG